MYYYIKKLVCIYYVTKLLISSLNWTTIATTFEFRTLRPTTHSRLTVMRRWFAESWVDKATRHCVIGLKLLNPHCRVNNDGGKLDRGFVHVVVHLHRLVRNAVEFEATSFGRVSGSGWGAAPCRAAAAGG